MTIENQTNTKITPKLRAALNAEFNTPNGLRPNTKNITIRYHNGFHHFIVFTADGYHYILYTDSFKIQYAGEGKDFLHLLGEKLNEKEPAKVFIRYNTKQ